MKKALKMLGASCAAALVLSACGGVNAQDNGWKASSHRDGQDMVIGSGRMVERSLVFDQFDSLAIDGPVDVVIRQGPTRQLTIRADDNIIDMVRPKVLDGMLSLATRGSFRTREAISAVLTVPTLDRVEINASGDVRFEGWTADRIALHIGGSGNIALAGAVRSVRADIGGSGDIDLTRLRTAEVDADIDGSGAIRMGSLGRLDASVDGSGAIEAGALDTLDAQINGSGEIRYRSARTVIRSEVNGTGSIRRR